MAQETLGNWGGTLATVTYVFLGYTSMIAYSSKSGEILFHLINLPESVSGFLFTGIFTILISVGGTQATDQVNQWLTISMIGSDLARLRASVFIGSLVPLLALLVWDAIALGLSSQADQIVDPVELLMG
ncbi:Tryptophan/tyrosine permease [Corchorus olitorius]|uniref:Tryptophan/tyrosine permease n=1 Tax=Corchorus olitorius TaxID=93759 RepID=A0A1R3IFD2_9ROSI|nr:Tryptophan/tyrosine permease [Corchorus olitorius]